MHEFWFDWRFVLHTVLAFPFFIATMVEGFFTVSDHLPLKVLSAWTVLTPKSSKIENRIKFKYFFDQFKKLIKT